MRGQGRGRNSLRLHGPAARVVEARQQDGEDAGEKNAVESPSAADRSDRRAEAAHLVEVGEVDADEGAQAAGHIGRR